MRPRISIIGSVGHSVGPSVGRSVRRSVGWLVTLSSKTREIDIFDQIVKKNHVITSLCNNSINKMNHRWPRKSCFFLFLNLSRSSDGRVIGLFYLRVFLSPRKFCRSILCRGLFPSRPRNSLQPKLVAPGQQSRIRGIRRSL